MYILKIHSYKHSNDFQLPHQKKTRINFQRIIPKANIFKSSEVFKHLNEEAMKSRADKEKEVKRWTTFLQKPNRPIPKPKNLMDIPYQEPYRVRIVRQPKPLCDPNRVQTPPIPVEPPALEDIKPIDVVEDVTVDAEEDPSDIDNSNEENEAIDIEDDDVPDLLDCPDEIIPVDNVGNGLAINGTAQNISYDENGNENYSSETDIEAMTPNVSENDESFDSLSPTVDPVLGKQLADVQQQLQALSHLPSTIQATLETITKQIAEIMPALQMRASIDLGINGNNALPLANSTDELPPTAINGNGHSESNQSNGANDEADKIDAVESTVLIDTSETPNERPKTPTSRPKIDMVEVLASNVEEQVTKLKIEKCFEAQEEAWEREKEKKDVNQLPLNMIWLMVKTIV